MNLRDFHNGIRVLFNIDAHDFTEAGLEMRHWPTFRDDPVGFFLRADDETADKLFAIVEKRTRPRAPVADAVMKLHDDTIAALKA